MRKLAAGVIVAAIALMIAALPSTDQAQQAVATPSGEALQAKAERVRDAFLKGSPEEFMSQFAPWVQGRISVLAIEARHESTQALKGSNDREKARFEEKWENRASTPESDPDPSDMLKIKTLEDLSKLTDAQQLAFQLGYYRVRGGSVAESVFSAQWFLVDRSVGFEQYQDKTGKVPTWLSRTRGKVVFATPITRYGVAVTCVAEGDAWHAVDFEYQFGKEKAQLADQVSARRWSKLGATPSDARRSEGEQIMGSLKGQARVAFAKLGSTKDIKKLTGAIGTGGCGAVAAELAGRYFKVRDKVVAKDAGGELMCEPTTEDSPDGFGVCEFKWAGGDGTFTWYDTLEDLYAAHPEFK